MGNAADVIAETLIKSGVKRIYGLPGDSLNGFTDAIRRSEGKLEWVHVRHEEVAAFAAGAEAHLTDTLAVCCGSCGPGNLHLINGLYDCHRSRVPVLAIAAQIPSFEIGTNYFQETHPERLFRDCSSYCEAVNDPGDLPRILEIALRSAVSTRGVSVVVIPGDVLLGKCEKPARPVALSPVGSRSLPSSHSVREASDLLDAAKTVTILAGAGCAGSRDELIGLAAHLGAPIVHALRGKEYLEYENPFDIGLTGLIGFASGYEAMQRCEALLMVGTDFPYTDFYPKNTKVVQIDVRGEQIGRRAQVDVGLVGTAKETLAALLSATAKKTDHRHLNSSLEHYASVRRELDHLADVTPGRGIIHPQSVAKIVDEFAADDAVFTCDVGNPTIWAARYLHMNGRRRLIGSFNHGSMASALPQAIGAQAAFRGRQIVSMSGDGGLAMLLGDLLTLKQMQLPIKVVVFNNASLGFVELEMKAAGFLDFGTSLINPSFAGIAEACGMRGTFVERPEDLREALRATLAHDGPALVEVAVNRQELSMPPAITAKLASGFSLYLMRAVLNGRADEILDLATTNVLR